MDQAKFQEAKSAYDAGDFRAAAKGFLAAARKSPAGSAVAYHMAGNALMRLRRHQDAVSVYTQALRDEVYDRRGALHANIGAAYAALGEYAEAVRAYSSALEEVDYLTPWKALQGLASAELERGHIEEAAIAYRKAAIDSGNPCPGKALVNLGLCFMGLGRPADAAEAYKAALGMDAYAGRGKALANLGIAYVQMGQYVEAVKAFERATQLHGHQLSSVAQQSYDAALDAAKPSRPTVEGWETGDLVTVQDVVLTGDGWATGELACLSGAVAGASEIAANVSADAAADTIGIGDEKAVEEFFSLTEDEMRQRAKSERRAARKTAGPEGLIRRIAVMLVLIASLSGLGAWAYLQGYGWPTQQSTVMGMLDDYRRGLDVGRYWVAVTDKDLAREMAKVPPEVKEFTVDAVDGRATVSTVSVTVTPVKGAPLHYRITLRREGVGWKVDGVENDWRSTEQSRAPKRTPEDPIREREDT